MDKILSALAPLLEKLTLARSIALGLVILFSAGGYIAYQNADAIGQSVFGQRIQAEIVLSSEDKAVIKSLMRKYSTIAYITVLKFDFERNTRTPFYRVFNDPDLKELVYKRLAGGDGSLPIFIKDDSSNNNQMITIIQGGTSCDPFANGGIARVWPDLVNRLAWSCLVSIPPAFGSSTGTRGYLVAHLSTKITQYDLQALTIDLNNLSTLMVARTFKSSAAPMKKP